MDSKLGRGDFPNAGKIMLVCATPCEGLEKLFVAAGYEVTKVNSGPKAIHRVQRQPFDATILVSTGASMDSAETILNIRDINESMHIAVIVEQEGAKPDLIIQDVLLDRFPRTKILPIGELEDFLKSLIRPKRYARESWNQ